MQGSLRPRFPLSYRNCEGPSGGLDTYLPTNGGEAVGIGSLDACALLGWGDGAQFASRCFRFYYFALTGLHDTRILTYRKGEHHLSRA